MLNTPQVAPPKPKVKGFICVNTHPEGCYQNVDEQIAYARSQPFEGAKTALIIGCSSGYGLASRIALSFGSNTDTLGVYFDRAPSEKRSAGAGWYNNQHLEQRAAQQGLAAHARDGDCLEKVHRPEIQPLGLLDDASRRLFFGLGWESGRAVGGAGDSRAW